MNNSNNESSSSRSRSDDGTILINFERGRSGGGGGALESSSPQASPPPRSEARAGPRSSSSSAASPPAAASSAASAPPPPPATSNQGGASPCHELERSLTNLGHALSCSICRSTPGGAEGGGGGAVLLSECVHLFCPACVAVAFRDQQRMHAEKRRQRGNDGSSGAASAAALHCPVCRQPVQSRRSALDAPGTYRDATVAYKGLLRAFGLAPAVYAPHLCMTQQQQQQPVPDRTDDDNCGDDDARAGYQMSILFAEHYRARERERQQQSASIAGATAAPSSLSSSAAETALREEQDEIVRINRGHYMRQLKKKNTQTMRKQRKQQHLREGSPGDAFATGLAPSQVGPTQDSCLVNAQDQFAADAAWEEHCRSVEREEELERQQQQQQEKGQQVQEQPSQQQPEATTTFSPPPGGGGLGGSSSDEANPGGRPTEAGGRGVDEGAGNRRLVETPASTSALDGGGRCGAADAATSAIGGVDHNHGSHEDEDHGDQKLRGSDPLEQESAPAEAAASLVASEALPPSLSQVTQHTDHRGRIRPEPPQRRPHGVFAKANDSVRGGTGGGGSLTTIGAHVTPYLRPKDGDSGSEASSGGENHNDSEDVDARTEALLDEGKVIHPEEPLVASNGTGPPSSASCSQHQEGVIGVAAGNDASLPVGTVVDVAPRTWPGMNKPGGVARITQVHRVPESGEVSYGVQYVLGGTESRVDAVFVTRYKDDDMGTTTTTTAAASREAGRAARRRSEPAPAHHRKSNRLEQHTAADWSPSLIEQLAKEGFDVSAAGPNSKAVAVSVSRKRPGSSAAPTDKPRAKKLRRIGADIADFVRRRLPRSGHHEVASIERDEGSRKENKPANEIAKTPPPTPPSLPAYSPAECCRRADLFYCHRVADAVSKGCIYVAASSLTDDDNRALDSLCRDTKSGKVQVKRVERIQTKKTTFCLIPAEDEPTANGEAGRGTDLTASKRTIKAMQATLAGVPLVSSSWLQLCQGCDTVPTPLSTMWIRSLPCSSTYTAYGVARLAAHLHDDSAYRPLAGLVVHYCGTIPRQKETDMSLLLREAGATLILSSGSLHSHLARPACHQSTVVLVCGGGVKFGGPLEAKIRQMPSGAVHVVHSSWVFDCISSGRALGPGAYEPVESGSQARELWKLTHTRS